MCNTRFSQSNSSKKLYWSKSGWELTLDTKDNSNKKAPVIKATGNKSKGKKSKNKIYSNNYKRIQTKLFKRRKRTTLLTVILRHISS